MKKTSLILFLLLGFAAFGQQKNAQVDTVSVYSQSMKKDIKNVVILPYKYNKKGSNDTWPVLYLLHGAGGDYSNWIKRVEKLPDYATEYKMIIVCPDGEKQSWYWDSPVDSASRYETFITEELVSAIDNRYRTIADKKGRAITGLSMGGHGALWLAFHHQDVYGGAGSLSGGVDISSYPSSWGIDQKLGPMAKHPERWKEHSVMGSLHLLKSGELKIIFDCGRDDFFYEVNEQLHRNLLYKNIAHDYISRPGKHDWDYWRNSIKYQLMFFHSLFY